MLKFKRFYLLLPITLLGLVGCASIKPMALVSPSGHPQDYAPNIRAIGAADQDARACEQLLQVATANLAAVKGRAKNNHVYADWRQVNQALAAANAAQSSQQYSACIEQAKAAENYIERNNRYIKWRSTMNL